MHRQAHVLLIVFLCYSCRLFAQLPGAPQNDTITSPYLDINQIGLVKLIGYKNFEIAFIDPKVSLDGAIPDFDFKHPRRSLPGIPAKDVTKRTLIRFNVCNTADSGMFAWFFPGAYYWNVELYKQTDGGLQKINAVRPRNSDSIAYRKLFIDAHDTVTIIAALVPAKTSLNRLNPRLIQNSYLNSFIEEFHNFNSVSNLITYIFCGLFLMMILYSLSNYVLNGNMDFLYYSGYAFFIGLMLLIKAIYTFHTNRIAFFQEEYLDFILQCTAILLYMIFMQKFLSTKTNHRFLYHLYNVGIGLLIAAVAGYTYFHYFSDNFLLESKIENYTKIFLLILTAIFLGYSVISWRDKLLRFLFWGNLCLLMFSLLSLILIIFRIPLPGIFQSSILFYEIGLFFELVFFLAGLNHKNKIRLIADTREREKLKAENLKKELEKELAVLKAQQEERERISADMHDELGSGMTAIRLMSEIAKNKMKEGIPSEINKISNSADEVLNKMNAIIWSMNSENDTVDNLISYIRSYALEYFDNTPLNCKVNNPEKIPHKEISGDKRRNIFLCVKETLNNALKHARASEIRIDFEVTESVLTIRIADNGVGIDLEKIRQFGNGLKNISNRMKTIGGKYQIENNRGTLTTLTLPL